MKNPFLRFKIDEKDYIGVPNTEWQKVSIRKRAFIFLLDFLLFYFIFLIIFEFIELFLEDIPKLIPYLIFGFLSIIFILIEYTFDGTIFKVLFGIRSISTSGNKLPLYKFAIKYPIRVFVIIGAYLYFIVCTAIILWLFGIHKLLFQFMEGKLYNLWHDETLKQLVIYVPDSSKIINDEKSI